MSETTRNEKCTDCEHAASCSSAGFDLTCATGKWARRGAPQRTEETMPEEIDARMNDLCSEFPDPLCEEQEIAVAYARRALQSAILRALRSPADRIAELEARVGTLSVALEMARAAPASPPPVARKALSDVLDEVDSTLGGLESTDENQEGAITDLRRRLSLARESAKESK